MTSIRVDDPTGSIEDAVLLYDYPGVKAVYLNLRRKRPDVVPWGDLGRFAFRLYDERSRKFLAVVSVDVDGTPDVGWSASVDVSRHEVYLFLWRMTREDLDAGRRATR